MTDQESRELLALARTKQPKGAIAVTISRWEHGTSEVDDFKYELYFAGTLNGVSFLYANSVEELFNQIDALPAHVDTAPQDETSQDSEEPVVRSPVSTPDDDDIAF